MPYKSLPTKTTSRPTTNTTTQSWDGAGGVANGQVPTFSESATATYSDIVQYAGDKYYQLTPNFRSLVASKQALPHNPFMAQFLSRDVGTWTYVRKVVSFNDFQGNGLLTENNTGPVALGGLLSGNITAPPFPSSLTTSDDLYLRMRTKIKRHDFQGGVFAYEAKKSSQMIVNLASMMTHVIIDLKQGRLIQAYERMSGVRLSRGKHRNHPHAPNARAEARYQRELALRPQATVVANKFLEWKYGWTPLMSDIKSAVVALEDIAARQPTTKHRMSSGLSSSKTTSEVVQVHSNPNVWGRLVTRVTESRRMRLQYAVSSDSVGLRQLGLTNPLSIAWEALPLSFVADWFLPIGQYLNSLDAGIGLSYVDGDEGYKLVVEMFITTDQGNNPSDVVTSVTGQSKASLVYRNPISSLPAVMPSNLTLSPKLGASQAESAIALLAQRIKSLAGDSLGTRVVKLK